MNIHILKEFRRILLIVHVRMVAFDKQFTKNSISTNSVNQLKFCLKKIYFWGPLILPRNSHRRCSVSKGVLRNFTKFTGNTCTRVSFLIKLHALNFAEFTRTPFLQNTSGRLFLWYLDFQLNIFTMLHDTSRFERTKIVWSKFILYLHFYVQVEVDLLLLFKSGITLKTVSDLHGNPTTKWMGKDSTILFRYILKTLVVLTKKTLPIISHHCYSIELSWVIPHIELPYKELVLMITYLAM